MTHSSDSDPLHRTEDQEAVFRFLGDPATHGVEGAVVRIDTHGAIVFLAGPDAYKVKRAVKFPFMDYSTVDRRRDACHAEVAINRPYAPGIYLGVVEITEDAARLSLDGPGTPVDYAVHMRRFDETLTLDRVAARGGLDDDLLAAVVDAVLASHAAAPRRPGRPAADDLALYVTQNREAFAENADVFPPADAVRLVERQSYEWVRAEPLLLERGEEGFVRRCHGDLHLRNIVLIDGRPVLFDAVEFSDAIATGDVLYDLAFLVMDLWGKGHTRAANLVLNRYLRAARADAIAGLAAMPLFLSIRASIRAKVTAAGIPALPSERRAEAFEEARRYFALSIEALKPVDPVVVAIGGLSGTGKSTLAAALAPTVGRLPGAIHLSSDVLRKRLAGVMETERLPAASYTRAASERVYAELRAETAAVLAAGEAVVVDAVHLTADERDAVEAVALGAKARFLGVWLEAPLDDIVARIEARRGGPSDATADVARRQAAADAGAIGWLRVDTRQGLDATLARVAEAIRARA